MSRYYVSTGQKGCFYTLRYSFLERYGHGSVERDYHVCNLSTDPEEAVARAKQRVGEGHGFTADFSVRAIERRPAIDWSVFQAGAKTGESIHEVLVSDRDYLVWACEALAQRPSYAKTIELARSLVGQDLTAREAERQRQAERQAEERSLLAAILSPLAERLKDGKGGFRDSVAEDLQGGRLPAGRGLGLVIEILAKCDGRKGSAAYTETEAAVRAVFERAGRVPASLEERARFAPLLSACDRMCDGLIECAQPAGAAEIDAVDALTAACGAVRERLTGLATPQLEDLEATIAFGLRVREHLLLRTEPESYEPLLAALEKAVSQAGEPWVQDFALAKKTALIAKSFLCEVEVGGSWSTNGLRFASPAEAEDYGRDLYSRWTGPSAYRARARMEQPSARFAHGAVELLQSSPAPEVDRTVVAAPPEPATLPPASEPKVDPLLRDELLAAASEFVALWNERTDCDSGRARLAAAAAACGICARSDDLLMAARALPLEPESEGGPRLQRAVARERAIARVSTYLEENPRDVSEALRRLGQSVEGSCNDLELVRCLVDAFIAVDARGLDQFTSGYLEAACRDHGVRTFADLSHGTLAGLVTESIAFSMAQQAWLMDQVPAKSGGEALWSARHGGAGFHALGTGACFSHLQSAAIAAGPKRMRRASNGKMIDEGAWDGELFEVLARELCPAINASWSPAESLRAALERLEAEGTKLDAGEFPSGWVAVPQGRRGVFVVSSDGWRHRLLPNMDEARAFARERPYRFSLCASSAPPAAATHVHCVEAPRIAL